MYTGHRKTLRSGHLPRETMMRDRDAKGDFIGDIQYRSVFGRALTYDDGTGVRVVKNRLSPQLEFAELFQGKFVRRTKPWEPIYTVTHNDLEIALIPYGMQDSAPVKVEYIGGSSELFYANAFPNADLKLTLGGHIIHKDILLKAGHAWSYTFNLRGVHSGWKVVMGRINFDDGTSIAPPVLRFDVDYPEQPSPIGKFGIFDFQLEWDVVLAANGLLLTVELPPHPNGGDWAGWVLDPVFTVQPDDTDGIDTYVKEGDPTVNYETNALIRALSESHSDTHRLYIKFDISPIPEGSTVDSNVLSTWMNNNSGTPTLTHNEITASWTESTMTWNTGQPSVGGGMGAYSRAARPTAAALTDSEVQEWLDVENEGLRMTCGGTSVFTYLRSASFSTAEERPEMAITYTPPSSGIRASMWFSLAGLAIPAATVAGLYRSGAVAL